MLHHKNGDALCNPEDGSNWEFLCCSCHKLLHIYGRIPTREELIELRKTTMRKSSLLIKDRMERRAIKRNIPPGYITTNRVVRILNVSKERVRQLRNAGKIEFVKMRGAYLHFEKSVIDYNRLSI